MQSKSPKEQLSTEDLIGFVRSGDANGQELRRASSAKVTKPAIAPSTPAGDAAERASKGKSGS